MTATPFLAGDETDRAAATLLNAQRAASAAAYQAGGSAEVGRIAYPDDPARAAEVARIYEAWAQTRSKKDGAASAA